MFVDGFAEDFFIDAYAASGLAGTNDYAVLLTNGEDLTPETAAWLDAAAFAQEGGVDVYCMPKVTEAACEAGVTATGGDPADLQTVTIEDGLGPVEQDIAAVDITDAPATVTTGSDFDLEVTVTDADDEGIAEQAVTLSTDPDSDLDDEVAITDADGVAVFTDLTFTEAGEYDVTATAGEVSDTVTITATAPTDGGGGGVA
ncbi:Ig-like domain-containing protein, partial [Euzebya sp.]|uniref:Ig-like domain-containing protein n=1 Tax=Euzebya sp. TaxID=1971409 RepID=UPI0035136E37